jgi:putative phosphoribosyl transferase
MNGSDPSAGIQVIQEALSPGRPEPPAPFFASRVDAGGKLGAVLRGYADGDPVVVGVAQGGVVVAAEVAKILEAPLDMVAVESIEDLRHPGRTVAAVAADTGAYVRGDGELEFAEIATALDRARLDVELFERRLRARVQPLDLEGRNVFVVDDGIVTGTTMVTAIRSVRARGASRIVVAVPVGGVDGLTRVLRDVTETVCLHVLHHPGALSDWYRSFPEIDEDTVVRCIEQAGLSGAAVVADE